MNASPAATLAGLTIRDLEYAVAVDRERHFGRAAELCSVSQAALSEQLRKLEGVLGVALFERTKRHVAPTPRGRALLDQAVIVLSEARRFMALAQSSAEPMTGELRVGVIATLGPYYIPAILAEGRRRFPRLGVRLREGQTAGLVAALRAGELDAVIAALPLPAPEDGLTAEPLFFEPFQLACPTDHTLATREPIGLDDLGAAGLLLMEDGHCLRDQALALCNRPRLDRHTRVASSIEMLRHMIAAGEGYSLIPMLAAGVNDPRLRDLIAYRTLDDPTAGRTIGLIWRATETRSDDLRTIAAFLRETAPTGTTANES